MLSSRRLFGLDLLRAAAIVLVVAAHCLFLFRDLSSGAQKLHLWLAFLGVEGFFVLSGYLVGSLALRETNLGRFWARRWLRTLPLYYLFLLLHLFLATPADLALSWRHFVFLQNPLGWEGGGLFDASWSLAVEEWFYLALPLSLAAWRFAGLSPGRCVLFTVFGLGGISFLLRFPMLLATVDWDAGIRKAAFLRFDALMFGVGIAYLEARRQSAWQWLQKHGPKVSLASFLLAVIFFYPVREHYKYLSRVTVFPLVSLTFAAVLPALAGWRSATGRSAEGVRALARWSYALYLSHTFALVALTHQLGDLEKLPVPARACVTVLFVVASVASAALLHRYFEKPILDWRDRQTQPIPSAA
jgi:peptidoglycan/LPS O-acetylase OafA/YrhL